MLEGQNFGRHFSYFANNKIRTSEICGTESGSLSCDPRCILSSFLSISSLAYLSISHEKELSSASLSSKDCRGTFLCQIVLSLKGMASRKALKHPEILICMYDIYTGNISPQYSLNLVKPPNKKLQTYKDSCAIKRYRDSTSCCSDRAL